MAMPPRPNPYNFENSDYSYSRTYGDHDRQLDKNNFVNSKLGVKGWVDGYLSSGSLYREIPTMFYHEQVEAVIHNTNDYCIPLIDLSRDPTEDFYSLMPKIRKAATEVGIFKIINHGMNLGNIDSVLTSVRRFHELDPDSRKYWYKTSSANTSENDAGYYSGIHYVSNYDIMATREPAYWQDLIHVRLTPDRLRNLPTVFRSDDLEQFEGGVKWLADRLLDNLSVGLGYPPYKINGNEYEGRSALIGEYYPHCPQPDHALGFRGHTAPGMINIMFPGNSEVHVKTNSGWVRVMTDPGTLLVKIGELFQIISNDVYKAPVHRVPANRDLNPRVAAFVPFTPGDRERQYGPFQYPTQGNHNYRNFTFHEYNLEFYGKPLDEYTMLRHFSA